MSAVVWFVAGWVGGVSSLVLAVVVGRSIRIADITELTQDDDRGTVPSLRVVDR